MRLVHVVPTYLPAIRYGGPIVAVHGLCRALVARGHDVEVLTTNVDGKSVSDVPIGTPTMLDGVKVTYFSSRFDRLYWSPSMQRAIRAAASRSDLLHAHSVYLYPTLAAARAARSSRTPFVISPRGMLVPELIERRNAVAKKLWIATIEKRNFATAAAIHFTSEQEWSDAANVGLPLHHPFVVPNGIDLPPLSGAPRRPHTLVFLGRISWKKGLDRLITALAEVPEATLIIAGNDDEDLTPKLKRIASDAGVSDRIEWRGPTYGAEKHSLLATASLFALTSDSENFGNAVLEALAVRTPALLTRGVGLAPDVAAAAAGIVTERDPHAIAAALRDALADPNRLQQLGANGRKLVESRFTWSRVAEMMEQQYRSLSVA